MFDATVAADVSGLPVTLVHACQRAGRGGSPTAVVDESALGGLRGLGALTDEQRRTVPWLTGASHAVFVSPGADVSLRFFTTTGELPGCGHGTVAALAFLAARAGSSDYRATLRTGGGSFAGRVTRAHGDYDAAFEPGPVTLRGPAPGELDAVLDALGVAADAVAPGGRIATLGRARLLLPVATPTVLAALVPDFDRLRAACDSLGLLGCYVHCETGTSGAAGAAGLRFAARMFAPSIGVPEDVANANSTACLAAHLAREGRLGAGAGGRIGVDMGDSLGTPSTITATATAVGGAASLGRRVRL
ncbi:PhzF family phenazine biosynthesis protein [Kitasatospora sp. A2-31]|uniref:PhzF family phenazine biosynthesis protein n=1 Tax=Kitasatospora sp. A2-31 TaxID=2916414 RepID=UPI001EEB4A80|nr:PhzF family phenazine biosynthesis protein [Kitasatospora sp. A2-31]MCG6495816.1 PhzF family phenazine biosynthesis protein [Kitasatospora sp. A2-31]